MRQTGEDPCQLRKRAGHYRPWSGRRRLTEAAAGYLRTTRRLTPEPPMRAALARRTSLLARCRDAGGTATGFLLAVLVLIAVGVAAFFYFGGEADVNIKEPDVTVTTTSNN